MHDTLRNQGEGLDCLNLVAQRAQIIANQMLERDIKRNSIGGQRLEDASGERIVVLPSNPSEPFYNLVFVENRLVQAVSGTGSYYIHNKEPESRISFGFGISFKDNQLKGCTAGIFSQDVNTLFIMIGLGRYGFAESLNVEYVLSDEPEKPGFVMYKANLPEELKGSVAPDGLADLLGRLPESISLDALIAKAVDPSGAGRDPEQAGPLATL